MTPQHHLCESTLTSFAAGSLSPEMAAVAATHLQACRYCRILLADAEAIGGSLLSRQQSSPEATTGHEGLRQKMLEQLDKPPQRVRSVASIGGKPEVRSTHPDQLPTPLRPYFGASWSELRWRWTAPGLHMVRAMNSSKDKLILLKVAPGRSMPVHSHQGTELTQILKGAYTDRLGRFGPGDAADLDNETEHQPVSEVGEPCICVAALDAPLNFPGWLARKLQPMVGL